MPSDIEKSQKCGDHKNILNTDDFVIVDTSDIEYKDLPESLKSQFNEECIKKFGNPPALLIVMCTKCRMHLTFHLNAIWWSGTT